MADTNEQVARACGFTAISGNRTGVFIEEWCGGMQVCEFDTNPAAALFAADAYADLRKVDLELYRERHGDEMLHWCKFEGVLECCADTREAAICRTILQTGKNVMPERPKPPDLKANRRIGSAYPPKGYDTWLRVMIDKWRSYSHGHRTWEDVNLERDCAAELDEILARLRVAEEKRDGT